MTDQETHGDRIDRLSKGPRLTRLETLLAETEAAGVAEVPRLLRRMSLILVDSILEGDEPAVELALDGIHRLQSLWLGRQGGDLDGARIQGRLDGLLDVAMWGSERMPSLSLLAEIEGETHSHEFLALIHDEPAISNLGVAAQLGWQESEVSRVGRRLAQTGLARKRRVGRTNAWHITPRGVQALQALGQETVPRPRRPHQTKIA
jgi:DNA-binding MarR family transcriptional regulator